MMILVAEKGNINFSPLNSMADDIVEVKYEGKTYRFRKSTKKGYKYDALLRDGRIVHFGRLPYQHYMDKIGLWSKLDHGDKRRRSNYRSRHKGIITADGTPAVEVKESPAWFALHFLW